MKFLAILLAATGLVVLGLLLQPPPSSPPFARVAFDAEQWRDLGPIDFGELRLAMAQDLLASGKLVGLHRTELQALLGSPTYHDERSRDLGYELSEEHPSGKFDATGGHDLFVRIGPDDRAIEALIRPWHAGD